MAIPLAELEAACQSVNVELGTLRARFAAIPKNEAEDRISAARVELITLRAMRTALENEITERVARLGVATTRTTFDPETASVKVELVEEPLAAGASHETPVKAE